ncbi:MAG: DUF2330 domain-containing protein [Myxococcales bacterium]|nr:DUF2330 domain-containing protein [Myxococcales bacterium]
MYPQRQQLSWSGLSASWLFGIIIAFVMVVATPSPARACGGFFCNAVSQSPIYQAGERVVFAKDGDAVVMHIEVTYQGPPTEFGWILPLVDVPTDADGNPLPLDQAVSISSPSLFSTLQSNTDPTFTVSTTFDENLDSCSADRDFPLASGNFGGGVDAAGSEDTLSAEGEGPPKVAVLQSADIGPYAAQLIQATDSQALFDWLNDNGYTQDPKALPLLDHYVASKYVFVGLKLQNEKSTGDLKPVALRQGELAPCVPLRLTSIAATPNMPILVWVLGPSRAIPKNFIHAVINDAAIVFPGGTNYLDRVNEAIDTLVGHAWVTEFSGPSATYNGVFWNHDNAEKNLANATDLKSTLAAVQQLPLTSAERAAVLMQTVVMPQGLKGYPWGNCYYDPWFDEKRYENGEWWYEPCPESNDEHLTTEAEFYNYLDYWVDELEKQNQPVTADLDKLRTIVNEEFVKPLKNIQAMFDNAKTITRFYTTQDPEEMTKDPIFAFNPDLGDVARNHQVAAHITNPNCAGEIVEITYATGQKAVMDCGGVCSSFPSLPAVPGAPALLFAQVIDETGAPSNFDSEYAQIVDAALNHAEAGKPSLPSNFTLPAADPVGEIATVWMNSDGTIAASRSAAKSGSGCQTTRVNAGVFAILFFSGLCFLITGVVRAVRNAV